MQTRIESGERSTNHAYSLCGLRLDSEFDLPALPAWDGPDEAPVEINCRRGTVPTQLSQPHYVAPLFQTNGTGEYLLALPGTGRILVRRGNEITVEPDAGAASNLAAILNGPIQAVLWHQRGLLPLHASVVVIDGRTVALCGCGAAGKSTLAAILAAEGNGVIADDICVVDVRNSRDVLVRPSCASLQLWPDALAELGVTTAGLKRSLAQNERYLLACSSHVSSEPHKLAAAVLMVRRHTLPPATLERLRGAQAADALYKSVHSGRPAAALGCAQLIFAAFTQMSSVGVSFWRLTVPEGRVALREAAAKLLATFRD